MEDEQKKQLVDQTFQGVNFQPKEVVDDAVIQVIEFEAMLAALKLITGDFVKGISYNGIKPGNIRHAYKGEVNRMVKLCVVVALRGTKLETIRNTMVKADPALFSKVFPDKNTAGPNGLTLARVPVAFPDLMVAALLHLIVNQVPWAMKEQIELLSGEIPRDFLPYCFVGALAIRKDQAFQDWYIANVERVMATVYSKKNDASRQPGYRALALLNMTFVDSPFFWGKAGNALPKIEEFVKKLIEQKEPDQ